MGPNWALKVEKWGPLAWTTEKYGLFYNFTIFFYMGLSFYLLRTTVFIGAPLNFLSARSLASQQEIVNGFVVRAFLGLQLKQKVFVE